MFLTFISDLLQQLLRTRSMSRPIITPRQLLPWGYNPPAFALNLDTDIESDMICFVVLCRPSSCRERQELRLQRATAATLWDTPGQDTAIRLYDNAVELLSGPDLFNPIRSFTSSESTGLTLYALGSRDIAVIARVTSVIRRLVKDDVCFDSFPVDIFDWIWSATRQLDIVTEWYSIIKFFFPGPLTPLTNTFLLQDKPNWQRQGFALQPPRAPVSF